MFAFHRLARQSFIQFAVALVAAGTWLSGCGDDEEGNGGGNKGGSSGSAGSTNGGTTNGGTTNGGTTSGGSAGSMNGGSTTGGSAGNPSGGSAGTPMGGSAGATGGSAGSAGTGGEGMGGEGMGGEGMGGEGMGGVGMGGEGGASDAMCASNDLDVMELNAIQQHDHLPINGAARTTLVNMINTGMPLVFTLPEDGTNAHQHTLTFTAQQLTTLRNGGTIAMMTTSTNGPAMNMHTHTYSIECAP